MLNKTNQRISRKFILWTAFYTNVLLFLIATYINSNILLSTCLIISLLIIQTGNNYKPYKAIAYININNSFFSYLKRLIGEIKDTLLYKNQIQKKSITFSTNPDKSSNEYLLHAKCHSKIKPKVLTDTIGSRQCRQFHTTSVLNFDISDYSSSGAEVLSKNNSFFTYVAHKHSVINSNNNATIILKFPINIHSERHSIELSFRELFSNPSVKGIELSMDITQKKCYSIREYMKGNNNQYFHSIPGFLNFIEKFREFVDGKPIGIRIGIGMESEFIDLCKEIKKRKIYLDFISITGDTVCTSDFHKITANKKLEYAITFAAKTIKKFGLENDIKIIAIGDIKNGFELLKLFSLGANFCMNTLPEESLSKSDISNKTSPLLKGIFLNYHQTLLRESIQLMQCAGFEKFKDIDPKMFFQKQSDSSYKNFKEIYFNKTEYTLNDLANITMYN